ncbi:Hypothetical protein D9617_11g009320 [Elsinoe fawcettii]|nr:Hypothetical protein D9617_11g009320 [Elsinoe fawcettii]
MRRRLSKAVGAITSRARRDAGHIVLVPPTPRALLSDRGTVTDYYTKPDAAEDTALDFVYRIYLAVLAGDTVSMINDIQSFWARSELRLENTPDPADPDPDRYAFVAAVMYLLVDAFNHNIELGLPRGAPSIITEEMEEQFKSSAKKLESVPRWAENAPGCAQPLIVPDREGRSPLDYVVGGTDKLLGKKNIVAFEQGIYFI